MRRRILCLCHDVTDDDIERAYARGYTDPEAIKRYTAAFMGPCQGRSCSLLVLAEIARVTGRDVAEIAPTTARPPAYPVRMGELAGGAPDPLDGA
jgi:bacterioferritin-associated ferredoxin